MSPSWVETAAGSGFDVDHLPLGVVTVRGSGPRIASRIGDHVLDLARLSTLLPNDASALLQAPDLHPFLAAGPTAWASVRAWLTATLTDESFAAKARTCLTPVGDAEPRLPVTVGDYVDFYASLDHASNVGRIFRPGGEPLTPNWRHLPIGYHGRAGTVVISGTPVRRPSGQRAGENGPSFGPSERLDIEAELGFVIGTPSEHGVPIPARQWREHVFGVCLLNDWSARDIQAWEYVPLGPFLGKSFATSVSGWITPLAALEAARCDLPGQDPEPLPHLLVDEPAGLDIDVEVVLNDAVVARPPYRTMYWSPAQMLAHLTSNGASVRTGDLYASGTISGPERSQRGSFLELCWGGQEPLADGRTFLRDGDRVTLRATAPGTLGGILTLGEVSGEILPARAA